MYNVTLTESYFPAQGGTPPAPLTICDMLRASAGRAPDAAAVKELTENGEIARVWTYAQLLADSERLGRALVSRHPEGARVAVYANNIPEWLLLEMGCAFANLTLVTVNPAYQKRELQFVLEQSRAEAIYYIESFRGNPMGDIVKAACDELPAITQRIFLDDHAAIFAGEDKGKLRTPSPRDAAQIQYTSGTTGFPKGALLHHHGLVQNGIDAVTRGGIRQGDSFIHHMPLFHTTGCAVLALGGLASGATMLLSPGFDPAVIMKVNEREKCSFILGVPTMLVALIAETRRSGRDVSAVKRLMSGGAMVAPQLCNDALEVFGAPIQIVYGQTETSPVQTQTWYDDAFEDLTGTIGQALPYTEMSIRDPQSNEVLPISAQGEICARGYHVMLGYNDNPEATAATIDKDGWLHSGDLGRMDARGYLRITGRVKEMIIRGGENLFPVEIENAMLEHQAISEAAVVGVPDEKWGEQVACFIKAKGEHTFTAAELKAFVRERLSPQKTPAYWIVVTDWPMTGSGKVQKFKLAEMFEAGEFEILT